MNSNNATAMVSLIGPAIVTGSTGFIGRHLVAALADRGSDVYAVTRHRSDYPWPPHPRIRAIRLEPTTEGVIQALQIPEAHHATVFHLAGHFIAEHAEKDVSPLVAGNVLFGAQLLEAMRVNGIRRLVNAGTSWQHFGHNDQDAVSLYAATKQAFDKLTDYYSAAYGLAVTTLLLFDVYGPADPRPKLIPSLLTSLATGKPLHLSPGQQCIDLVYVDDVVGAFSQAAGRLRDLPPSAGVREAFSVRSGCETSLQQLVTLIGRLAQRDVPVVWGARPYRLREVMRPWHGGAALPGWQPQVILEEGIRRVLASEGFLPKIC